MRGRDGNFFMVVGNVRQLLTESVLLTMAGALVGLAIGAVGLRALLAVNPGNIPRIGPDGSAVTLDWTVMGFTLLLALLTGIVFGLVPAMQASRADLNITLKETGARGGSGMRQNKMRGAGDGGDGVGDGPAGWRGTAAADVLGVAQRGAGPRCA